MAPLRTCTRRAWSAVSLRGRLHHGRGCDSQLRPGRALHPVVYRATCTTDGRGLGAASSLSCCPSATSTSPDRAGIVLPRGPRRARAREGCAGGGRRRHQGGLLRDARGRAPTADLVGCDRRISSYCEEHHAFARRTGQDQEETTTGTVRRPATARAAAAAKVPSARRGGDALARSGRGEEGGRPHDSRAACRGASPADGRPGGRSASVRGSRVLRVREHHNLAVEAGSCDSAGRRLPEADPDAAADTPLETKPPRRGGRLPPGSRGRARAAAARARDGGDGVSAARARAAARGGERCEVKRQMRTRPRARADTTRRSSPREDDSTASEHTRRVHEGRAGGGSRAVGAAHRAPAEPRFGEVLRPPPPPARRRAAAAACR